MSAFATITLDVDAMNDAKNTSYSLSGDATTAANAAADTSTTTASITAANQNHNQIQDMKVGISGGFGTFVVGRMEDFTTSKVTSVTDIASSGHSVEPGNGAGRTDDAIAYVSPSINGLTIGLAGYMVNSVDAVTAATGVTAVAENNTGFEDNSFDATDIALMYANGPLAVNVSVEDHNIGSASAGGTVEGVTAYSIAYTMGDLKLAAARSETDVKTWADADDTAVVATYTMGNNAIKLGWGENETASATAVTSVDSNYVELNHNFSARTQGYVSFYNTDTANSDSVRVGMQHTF